VSSSRPGRSSLSSLRALLHAGTRPPRWCTCGVRRRWIRPYIWLVDGQGAECSPASQAFWRLEHPLRAAVCLGRVESWRKMRCRWTSTYAAAMAVPRVVLSLSVAALSLCSRCLGAPRDQPTRDQPLCSPCAACVAQEAAQIEADMAVKAAAEEQKAAVSKLVAAKSMPEALKAALADPPVQTKDLEIKVRWRSGALRWARGGYDPAPNDTTHSDPRCVARCWRHRPFWRSSARQRTQRCAQYRHAIDCNLTHSHGASRRLRRFQPNTSSGLSRALVFGRGCRSAGE
jgi:hypothetical protein